MPQQTKRKMHEVPEGHKYCVKCGKQYGVDYFEGDICGTQRKRPKIRKEVVTKRQIHDWMDVNYGQPKVCEGKDCRKNSTHYDWAVVHGKPYDRKRENFLRLCRSCHRRYDMTPEKKLQAVRNLINSNIAIPVMKPLLEKAYQEGFKAGLALCPGEKKV